MIDQYVPPMCVRCVIRITELPLPPQKKQKKIIIIKPEKSGFSLLTLINVRVIGFYSCDGMLAHVARTHTHTKLVHAKDVRLFSFLFSRQLNRRFSLYFSFIPRHASGENDVRRRCQKSALQYNRISNFSSSTINHWLLLPP